MSAMADGRIHKNKNEGGESLNLKQWMTQHKEGPTRSSAIVQSKKPARLG